MTREQFPHNSVPFAFQALGAGLIPLPASPGVSCSHSHSSELPCRGSEPPKLAPAAANPLETSGQTSRVPGVNKPSQQQPGILPDAWRGCGLSAAQGRASLKTRHCPQHSRQDRRGAGLGTEALAGSRTARLAASPSRSSGKDIPASAPGKAQSPGHAGQRQPRSRRTGGHWSTQGSWHHCDQPRNPLGALARDKKGKQRAGLL